MSFRRMFSERMPAANVFDFFYFGVIDYEKAINQWFLNQLASRILLKFLYSNRMPLEIL